MHATLLLADAVSQDDTTKKVHALGLGWSMTASPTPPMAVILLLKIPWDKTNQRHRYQITLVDSDGHAVAMTGPDGATVAVQVTGEFEAGRPPGIPPGMPVDMSQVITVGPGMPLAAGQLYQWRLEINGEAREDWTAGFYVRP